VDINAMVFGMPKALYPAVAASFGGPAALGVLTAAPAVGSLLVLATSGWTRRVNRHGVAILVAAGIWGVGITLFGLTSALLLALVFLAVAGAADTVSGLFRTAMWDRTVPATHRGRMAGVELVSYTAGPALGDLEAGVVASLAGVRAAVVSGGVLCVLGTVVLGVALPALRRYDVRDPLPPEPAPGPA
jgi:MFS family permease